MGSDALARLSEAGVSIWLDDLSRERLANGSLAQLVSKRHVVGVTTNPTIFARAIEGGDLYALQIEDLALREVGVAEALRTLTTYDVRWACDVLRPVHDATDGVDGRVSIEVDPRLAYDTARTVAEARALWWLVDQPNLFVKIPAARQSLDAISACLAEGISINVTLLFSLDRYDEVVEAFLGGMERARDAGLDLSRIASVASFFVSRVDTEIDRRLDALGSERAAALRGWAGIANARIAYEHYERTFTSDRWQRLADAGARPQRLLWASTGVKDPAYDDTRYVTGLVAPNVVNTMPQATLDAVADHGVVPVTDLRGGYRKAHRVLKDLAELGIDYADVVQRLEDAGVAAFEGSWNDLGEKLATRLDASDRPASGQREEDAKP
ncbi:transaldolase [Streptacidiphilus pinicola]|uniref:Transaldolase n=1 Tax=Streptacidiphilus pinicola TaxID=2219663 RepID=A0A2X0K805_9ACTN|nr:transaldolase [Streptacidiphilus pinicola]RAG83350.1 transaldolase [Streptacidiphilus pinicola]